ncbi:MAG: rhomboid family intramembrane serine protease [Planctomycetota bacterium]|jgi:GlpG protein
MTDESAPTRESNDSGADATATTPEPTTYPWISSLAILACIGIFLGLAAKNDYESWDTLSKFGYLPADSIWDGGYWALVTSAFVHFELWHVAFNVYWLSVLGSRLERVIGSLPYLGFFVVSAFVSSSFQLAVSDDTGIGASGVVYAIFGFMWTTRHRHSQFKKVLNARTIQIFVVWLVGCAIAEHLEIWQVGNAAHLSGLLFGGAVAGSFALRNKRRLMFAGLAALLILSIIPLLWCPWSVTWLSRKAYSAHASERYDVALDRYTQIIHLDPDNAWAHLNRSYLYEAIGKSERAQADLRRARQLDPSIEQAE